MVNKLNSNVIIIVYADCNINEILVRLHFNNKLKYNSFGDFGEGLQCRQEGSFMPIVTALVLPYELHLSVFHIIFSLKPFHHGYYTLCVFCNWGKSNITKINICEESHFKYVYRAFVNKKYCSTCTF